MEKLNDIKIIFFFVLKEKISYRWRNKFSKKKNKYINFVTSDQRYFVKDFATIMEYK